VNIIVPDLTPEDHIQKRGDMQVLHAWFNLREHEQAKGEANLITQTTCTTGKDRNPSCTLSSFKEPKP
jgi:hypothetical protein